MTIAFGAYTIRYLANTQTGQSVRPQDDILLGIKLRRAIATDTRLGQLVRTGEPEELTYFTIREKDKLQALKAYPEKRAKIERELREKATPADILFHTEERPYQPLRSYQDGYVDVLKNAPHQKAYREIEEKLHQNPDYTLPGTCTEYVVDEVRALDMEG